MMYEPDNAVGVTTRFNDGDDDDDSVQSDPIRNVRHHHPIRYVMVCVAIVSLIVMSIGIGVGRSRRNDSPPTVRGGPALLTLEDWETSCALRSTQTDSGLQKCLDQCHQFVCCDYGDCDERGASEWIKENCDLFELWCPEDDNDDYYYDDDASSSSSSDESDSSSDENDASGDRSHHQSPETNDLTASPTITPYPTYIIPTMTPYPSTLEDKIEEEIEEKLGDEPFSTDEPTEEPTTTPYPTITPYPTYLLPTITPYPTTADEYDMMEEDLEAFLDSEFSPTLTPYPTITPEPTADELYPTITPYPTFIVEDED